MHFIEVEVNNLYNMPLCPEDTEQLEEVMYDIPISNPYGRAPYEPFTKEEESETHFLY